MQPHLNQPRPQPHLNQPRPQPHLNQPRMQPHLNQPHLQPHSNQMEPHLQPHLDAAQVANEKAQEKLDPDKLAPIPEDKDGNPLTGIDRLISRERTREAQERNENRYVLPAYCLAGTCPKCVLTVQRL